MTEEKEKAIERCKQLIKVEHANWIGISNQLAIKTVLNLIQKQQKEIESLKYIKSNFDYVVQRETEKKDKIIDELAYEISEEDENFQALHIKEIIQYFERKVDERI